FSGRRSWHEALLFACNATRRNHSALAKSIAPFAKARNKCTCVWTVFTTARTAGKPATLPLPILVSTDSKHIEIKLDADPRFAAAAAGGVRYLGEASGLNAEAARNLQSAILFAFEEAFEHLDASRSQVAVTLDQFADRIEVMIVHHADAPSVGLHTLLSAGK